MAYCAYCGSYVAQVSYTPCASCGKPTNGAPVGASGGGTKTASIVIGVIVGGLALIFILGILAAIAIPNLLTAQERAKQKRTAADMRSLAIEVETYRVDHNTYPADPGKRIVDAWGNELKYECTADGYMIVSAGKDGQFDPAVAGGVTKHLDCDLVFSNGSFVQYPESLGVTRGN